jgi:hypothetical protein
MRLGSHELHVSHSSRRLVAAMFATVVAATASWAVAASPSLAYTGPFCSNVNLGPGGFCNSSTASNIRRAIGKAPGGLTHVYISTGAGERSMQCYSSGCTADTGYLSFDSTGYGSVDNSGSGTHTYSGYLYQ